MWECFLTGFDAPWLNTLFVDKNLKYHGLIQAFSRTNRILGKSKAFDNIVCFRDLIANTQRAIEIFGDENSANIILEKSYNDYIYCFEDPITQKRYKGFVEISEELNEKFSDLSKIEF
nr:hypothetical protein [Mycoplasmopsis edwardii]